MRPKQKSFRYYTVEKNPFNEFVFEENSHSEDPALALCYEVNLWRQHG